MFEMAVLGALQGVVDWLPISSEGVLVLAQRLMFGDGLLTDEIRVALFLHLGSLLAVVVYFWNDVMRLLRGLMSFRSASQDTRSLLVFLIVSTVITGVVGGSLFMALRYFETLDGFFEITGRVVFIGIGLLLLVTSFIQFKAREGGSRKAGDLSTTDSVLSGVVQGFSVLPGFSRSGSTVAVLLLRKVGEVDALRVSFFMSLPVVLGGNLVLNMNDLALRPEAFAGLATSFLFGIVTIHALLGIAERLNFAWFTFGFAILTLLSAVFIFA